VTQPGALNVYDASNGNLLTSITDAAISGSTGVCVVAQTDTTPPEVACAVDIDLLWPPNHNLVDVGLEFVVIDDQDDDPVIEVFVFADEDDEEATGDGNHSPDSKDDGVTLRLRAERKGNSNGRVYLI
jgi:hypothetical protein